MTEKILDVYLADIQDIAVFVEDGPHPQFLVDGPHFKVLVAGLEPGQHIPVHPDVTAMYHFLAGRGKMTIGEQSFDVHPGVTVIAPDGQGRGMQAETRLIFLGAKAT